MKLIKKQDKFGHPIQLQFNNQGSTFNTACGGCVSIFVNIFMVVFVSILVKKWIRKEDDTLSTVIKNINKPDLGIVNFDDLGITPYYAIWDLK